MFARLAAISLFNLLNRRNQLFLHRRDLAVFQNLKSICISSAELGSSDWAVSWRIKAVSTGVKSLSFSPADAGTESWCNRVHFHFIFSSTPGIMGSPEGGEVRFLLLLQENCMLPNFEHRHKIRRTFNLHLLSFFNNPFTYKNLSSKCLCCLFKQTWRNIEIAMFQSSWWIKFWYPLTCLLCFGVNNWLTVFQFVCLSSGGGLVVFHVLIRAFSLKTARNYVDKSGRTQL